MPTLEQCVECGATLPAYWPKGLCARCAFDGALEVTHTSGLSAPSSLSPPPLAEGLPSGAFGDYELLEEIARGGMGVVYRARQKALDRVVAVKMILAGPLAGKEFVRRFRTEASAAAILQHPNIVAIHDVGVHEGRHYFSMDYVGGQNLGQLVGQQPLPPARAARYVQITAKAIHYAHQRGILHRDLKPSNVLVDASTDEPRVTDFGLARRIDGESSLTLSGQVLGSPNFMPPEQAGAKRGKVSPSSDVYALGGILYYLLTARAPFQADSLQQILTQVLNTEPIPPRLLNPSIPRDLETIALKCLEKEPSRRYQSARELADELGRFLKHEPIQARPVNVPEKVGRWCRRKPALALLILLVHLVGAAGLGGILWQWRRAESHATSEHLERVAGQRHLYVANMNLTQAAWEQSRISRVRDLLAGTATAPERGFEWYYWQRQMHLEETQFGGHLEAILAVAYSPDGSIVTGSADHTVKVWDAASGLELLTLRGHSAPVRSVAISEDGQRIVTGGWDLAAQVWEAATGKLLRTLRGHEKGVFSVAISRDGQRVVTGSRDYTAKLWDTTSGAVMRTFNGHSGVVWSVAFSPDGERIVTAGGWDKTAKVWSVTNDSPLLTFTNHHDAVLSVAFSPDGKRILSGSIDQTAQVWEAATGEVLEILEGHGASVLSVAFSPDGRRISTAGDDETARVWNSDGRYELLAVRQHGSPISSVAFSPDSQRIVTGGGSVGFSPDGEEQIGAGGGDLTAKVWEVANDREVLTLKGHTKPVSSATFSRDGRRIVTGSFDGTANVWDAASAHVIQPLLGHTHVVRSVAISPDGKRIVTGSWDRTAKVWNAATGEMLLTLPHDSLLISVAFSPDGRRIATAGQDPFVKVWDATSGELQLTLEGEPGWMWSVAFSPDGRRILTANGDQGNTAKLWDATTGKELLALEGHESFLFHAAFSPDGRQIVTSSADATARVWNAATGAPLATLSGHSDFVMSACFSPDGQRIVTCSRDQTIRLWDTSSGKELLRLNGRGGWIFSAAFSPDGRRILAGHWDGTATVWEAASAEQVANWLKAEQAAEELQQRERAQRLRNHADKLSGPHSNLPGVIDQWLVLLPIPFAGKDGSGALRHEQISQESQLRPRAGDRLNVGQRDLSWREDRPEGYVLNFNQLEGAQTDSSVAYAVCYIHSEKTLGGLLMKAASDNQSRAYLNGNLIYETTLSREYPMDEDVVAGVTLNAGTNALVFKVVYETGGWQGSVRFTDSAGQPVPGLRTTLTPP